MRSALRCVTVCVILAIAVCYDSEESNESHEDMFVNRFRANTFINIPGRNHRNNYRWGLKSVAERRSETCEAYVQCRVLAYRYGSQVAYQRFFIGQQGHAHGSRY